MERELRVAGVKPKQNGNGQPALAMKANGNGKAAVAGSDHGTHGERTDQDRLIENAAPPA